MIICGGGKVARTYIEGLNDKSLLAQGMAGITATRTNAKFVSLFFNKDPLHEIPTRTKHIKKHLRKEDIVISGALELKANRTTDSNAADVAAYLKNRIHKLNKRCRFVR